jgi:peptidase M1-like protein
MKNILRASIVFLLAGLQAASAQTAAANVPPVPAVEHYSLVFRLDPEHHMLAADAEISLKNSGEVAIPNVPALLYRLMEVQSVSNAQGKPLAFTQKVVKFPDDPVWQVNYVEVTLPAALAPKQSTTIHLKYAGQLFGYREAWGYVRETISNDYSLLRGETFAYPMIAAPTMASRRQNVRTSKFDYEVDTVVPEGQIALCGDKDTGEPKTQDGRSTFHCVGAPGSSFIVVVASKFKAFTDPQRNLGVYAMAADAEAGDRIMGEMRRSLDYYSSFLGTARGGGLTLIEVPDGWGSMTTTGHIFQSAAAFKDPKLTRELWHEVAHSWTTACRWGECDARVQRTRYFDEAFATYFEGLAEREFHGEDAFRKFMQMNREAFAERVAQDPRGRTTPIADYAREEIGGFSYSKGAWSLYVLQQILGKDLFRRAISEFLRVNNGKVEFEDFRRSLEKTSGLNLQPWFQQWILSGPESSAMLLEGKTVEEMAAKCRPVPAK